MNEVVHLLALVWREMPDLKNLEKLDSAEKLLRRERESSAWWLKKSATNVTNNL